MPLKLDMFKKKMENKISIKNYSLQDKFAGTLADCMDLYSHNKLNISRNRFTSLGVNLILTTGNIHQIKYLDLSFNNIQNSVSQLCEIIRSPRSLMKSLNIRRCGIRPEGIQLIVKELLGRDNVKYLNIGENQINDSCMEIVSSYIS